MLNISELEKRWLRYKIKSYIPHAVIFISLIVIIAIIVVFINKNQNTKKNSFEIAKIQTTSKEKKIEKVEKEKKVEKKIEIKKTNIIQEPIKKNSLLTDEIKKDNIKHKVKLMPSLDFMKKMQDSTQLYYQNEMSNDIYETENEHTTQKKSNKNIEKLNDIQEKEPQELAKKINIKRRNEQNDIQEVINRFKKNNNPALSLFVAKKYYELGDYHNSYNYALITNEINRDIEASWIIFAKSLVKLNEKNMAIQTLKEYIKHSQSNSARILLDEITSGKFK
jgi:predicted peroxiredoxin